MIWFAVLVGYLAIGAALLMNLYRLAKGPDTVDRVLALDTMVVNAIALIMLLGIQFSTTAYFEAALLFAMVAFISTVAFCKFMLRGDVIE
jgi:multicomponent K+:H+ antiporter subunit F